MRSLFLAILIMNSQSADGERPVRQLCGPIAVQMVLNSFGTHVTLPVLTDEVFEDCSGPTSSLASLDRTLKAHGIDTLCIDLGREKPIDWPHPVIVHFPATKQWPEGHFGVVWPKREADNVLVSLSPGEPARMSEQELAAERSRIVLLTSASPINMAAASTGSLIIVWLVLGAVVATVAQRRGILRRRRIE